MESLHIRFTPYDISGYSFTWLDVYDRYAVFREEFDDEGNPLLHYHIYIQNVPDCEKSLRNAITTNFKIPKVKRGQTNKYYALIKDWKDPDYIFKYGDVQRIKGFPEKEELERVVSGRKKYLEKQKASVQGGNITIYEVASPKVKRVNLNREIIAKVYDWYSEQTLIVKRDVSVKEIIATTIEHIKGHGRGINPYQVRDFVNEILSMDENKKGIVVDKIFSMI